MCPELANRRLILLAKTVKYLIENKVFIGFLSNILLFFSISGLLYTRLTRQKKSCGSFRLK